MELKLRHLKPAFGKKLLVEIDNDDIDRFQNKRKNDKASAREINMECAVLRMVLRKHERWHLLAPEYHPLPEREKPGKALTPDEIRRLLLAARKSRSQSLFPALMLLLNTGLRSSELRTMQLRQVDLIEHTITVGSRRLGRARAVWCP
jgi:integrase